MRIQMIQGDITQQNDVEAIVNAANESLLGGGGVDGAIHRAAGAGLLKECRKLGGCKTGEAKLTGAYDLPCQYVIHTVGPIYQDGKHGEEKLLKAAYENSMKLAMEHKIRTIAFPCISAGVYGYPAKDAAKIAIDTVIEFQKKNPGAFEFVRFVVFEKEMLGYYTRYMSTLKK